jgi:hypothetical protein
MQFDKLSSNSYISANFTTSNSPIVVVCGWLNGSLKPVSKYAVLYATMGYRVLILLSKSYEWIFYPDSLLHLQTFNRIKSIINPNEQFIIHLMSNGGCRSWFCLEKHLKTKNINPLVIVFDSCPSYLDLNSKLPNAFYTKNWLLNWAISLIIVIRVKFMMKYFPSTNIFTKSINRFVHELKHVPKLFLYSNGDKVISEIAIKKVVKEAKEAGSEVEEFNFGDSEHVAHLQKYPIEYQNIITIFLKKYIE